MPEQLVQQAELQSQLLQEQAADDVDLVEAQRCAVWLDPYLFKLNFYK